jgi:hypothetical protein
VGSMLRYAIARKILGLAVVGQFEHLLSR